MRRAVIFSATFQMLAVAVPFIWIAVRYFREAMVIYLVFYLIPLFLVLLVEMRTSFGRQARLGLGVTLLVLGISSFGVGFALAHRYPYAMSAQAFVIIVLMFSAVPLIPWGLSLRWCPFAAGLR